MEEKEEEIQLNPLFWTKTHLASFLMKNQCEFAAQKFHTENLNGEILLNFLMLSRKRFFGIDRTRDYGSRNHKIT
jgi:hypothetical protein